MDNPAIVQMIDFPEGDWLPAGLRRDFGDEFAARIVRLLAELQMARAPQEWPFEIHVAPGTKAGELRSWLGSKPIMVHAQLEAPWGERLRQAVGEAQLRQSRPIIVVRADCPYCDTSALAEAAWALRDRDVVVGPTTDGDFYLFGMQAWTEGLFEEINWGTNQVFFGLTARCQKLELDYHVLDARERVVDEASWERAVARLVPELGGGSSESKG